MRTALLAAVATLIPLATPAADEVAFEAGFAKLDATPTEPVRLSGYGNRDHPSEGVDAPLFLRAMALRPAGGETFVLVSFDSIGTPASFTDAVAAKLQEKYGIGRERFVLAGTHSHTTPHLLPGLSNLFTVPLSEGEQKTAEAYTNRARDLAVEVVGKAIHDLKPAKLSVGAGKAGFAMNRRVVNAGAYGGFGVTPAGAVDHTVSVLKVTSPRGEPRGVVFNYACHATTLEGKHYKVNPDWPGYAAKDLEETHPGLVALSTIGCGADSNPEPRGGERPWEHAQAHGRELSTEVTRVLKESLAPLTAAPIASFGFAGLAFDRPSREQLNARLQDKSPQVARHAANMLATWERMGRLPETYPMPVQAWRFGDELTMVFLGGEVVVDYVNRLRKEVDTKFLWATAYANDVFAYVASERVRREGGYEVDSSMIYYNQPGPWVEGTEDVLVRRIHDVLKDPGGEPALSPEDAKQFFRLPEDFEIDLVACEPLVTDPVNFAFGPDGRLWVAEMGDYPRGADGKGAPGGRIKVLTDSDRDGDFDEATLFLDGLLYPNGVMPWRDGALVSCAPDVFFAKDTNSDGEADVREVLLTGFPESNPQHRVGGFTFGLDNLVHLTHGANGITSPKTGKVYDLSGRDFALDPDTGEVVATSGDSQYGRCRTDFDDWFGNDNSNPLFHYVIEDRYLSRNPHVTFPNPKRQLITHGELKVSPASRTVDRFNDPLKANRFTSACGPTIHRDESLDSDLKGAAFICEPVHNLVRCVRLVSEGPTFRAERYPEGDREFLASADPWFRPVRLATGPDGGLYVADMYRLVIEHPEWIPEAWQARLDLRAGADKGRIWRVRRNGIGSEARTPPDLTKLSPLQLVKKLEDSNGAVRDLAQQLLVWRGDPSAVPALRAIASDADLGQSRAHAIGALNGLSSLDSETLRRAIGERDSRLVRFATQMSEALLASNSGLGEEICGLTAHEATQVRIQAALSLGELNDPRAAEVLGRMASRSQHDPWLRAAILSSATKQPDRILAVALKEGGGGTGLVAPGLIATILGVDPENGPQRVLTALARPAGDRMPDWVFEAVASLAGADGGRPRDNIAAHETVRMALEAARKRVAEPGLLPETRRPAVTLLAGPFATAEDRDALAAFLSPQTVPELQAIVIESLAKSGAAEVPRRLVSGWTGHSPALRGLILQTLLSRPEWAVALLDAAASGTLTAGDFDAAARDRLLSSSDPVTRDRAAALFGAPASSDKSALLAKYEPATTLDGDPARGRSLFEISCASCHKLGGLGNDFGPKLSALTDKSPAKLLTAVLDPNQAVEAKFRGYVAVTTDGRVLSGLVTRESSGSITLAGADGRSVELLRKEIEDLLDTGRSFMPEGLERDLAPQDLADVFAFVRGAAE